MMALYNDSEPFVANWLEDLIAHDLIAPGRVDRRSIADLIPADVAGNGQRHFFAGIGGWSYALRLAGVPDDTPVWTGSCPCQPFSDAGTGSGTSDPRHLWPAWFALIRQCRPPIIFGEQVASAAGLEWLDLVFADLEGCGYSVGAADLCAAGVGAPHIRQRLYLVAYADGEPGRLLLQSWRSRDATAQAGRSGEDGTLADPTGGRWCEGDHASEAQSVRGPGSADGGRAGRVADPGRPRRRRDKRMADANGPGLEVLSKQQAQGQRTTAQRGGAAGTPGATRGFWYPADWILCRDPSGGPPVARPVESGLEPLASGVPQRVGLLSGYGNAIVPQVAAEFIRAALDALAVP